MMDLDISIDDAELRRALARLADSVPKVASRTMQQVTTKARDDARRSAEQDMHKPRPATIKAIRNNWPNRAEIASGRGVSSVFVQPFLADQLAPLVFPMIQRRSPVAGRGIAAPTRKFRLNARGNVAGLRTGAYSRRRANRRRHFSVPLRSRSHLPPGLYERSGRNRRRIKLLVRYERQRRIRTVWRRYPSVVAKSYRRNFAPTFFSILDDEIQKARR